jgi:hypothetical protein
MPVSVNNFNSGGNRGQGGQPLSVTGNVSGFTLSLPAVNGYAGLGTRHSFNPGDSYDLTFSVGAQLKLPVNATLVAGPNLPSMIDLGVGGGCGDCGLGTQVWLGATPPSVGQTYGLNVTYADGTTDSLVASVTGVVSQVASLISPANNSTGVSRTPTFSWTLPSLPAGYSQEIWINPQIGGGSWIWNYAVPLGQTTAVYNADNSARQPSLNSVTAYSWGINIYDSYGNESDSRSYNFTTGP